MYGRAAHTRSTASEEDSPRLASRGWLVIAALTAACTAAPAGLDPSTDGSTTPQPATCPEIDLRAPSGDLVDLSGTWLGTDWGEHVLSQEESCVTWTGHSLAPAAEEWTFVFTGHVTPAFQLEGEGDYVVSTTEQTPDLAELALNIEFFEADGATWPTLWVPDGDPFWFRLAPEATVSDHMELVGIFEGTECLWLDVDGQRYEMWSRLTPTDDFRLMSSDGYVVARPGDQVRVDAQASSGWASPQCGAGPALLVWDLALAP